VSNARSNASTGRNASAAALGLTTLFSGRWIVKLFIGSAVDAVENRSRGKPEQVPKVNQNGRMDVHL
jgi:hypothetical protein